MSTAPQRVATYSRRAAVIFIILTGVVSLFADMNYEGGRSVVGQYLQLLGTSAFALGLAAGLGEFVGYAVRLLSGTLADRTRKYWWFIIGGYVVQLCALPAIGLTTDLIVAFPGETEEDFSDTLELARLMRYDSAFTFIYSKRAGTRAAELSGEVSKEAATERIERLIALQEGITKETLASLKGERMGILVEGVSARRESQMSGKCGRNISVNFTGGDEGMIGQIVPVKINGAGSNTLRGEYEKEQIT